MKNKIIKILIVMLIGMNALFMPFAAYAAEAGGLCLPAVSNEMTEDPAEPEKTPVLADIFIPEELPEPEETLILEEIPTSEENPVILESNESVIPDIPFTPDGKATVVDWVFDFDGKEFYTFTSPAGNVFYLIIDHSRANNNVYFLNAVTEADLMALAEKDDNPISVSAIPTTNQDIDPDEDVLNEDEPLSGDNEILPKSGGNTGMTIFLVLALLAVGGAGYYIKIVRPKQQSMDDDEDEYDTEYDDDKEYPYEDEEENTDSNDAEEYEGYFNCEEEE